MATTIVNSYNFFLDSERDINSASTGDNLHISLNETPITCATNQFLRLSLQSFSMYRSSTNVNPNNCIVRVSCQKTTGGTTITNLPVALDCTNFIRTDIAKDLALKIAEVIATSTGRTVPTSTTEVAAGAGIFNMNRDFSSPIPGTPDNILRVRIDYGTSDHLIKDDSLIVQCLVSDGDSFELLGANRLYALGGQSLYIDTATNSKRVDIYGFYPMQESTQQNTYLYCNLNSTNLQTKSYSAQSTDLKDAASGTESSRILGKIINNTDFNVFTTETNMEYFLNLSAKTLNFIELRIADSHNRPIPPAVHYKLDTGLDALSGVYTPKMVFDDDNFPSIGNKQNTLGNRSFEACIKIDVVQVMSPPNNTLNTPPPQNPVNPRITSNVLSQVKQPSDYLSGY